MKYEVFTEFTDEVIAKNNSAGTTLTGLVHYRQEKLSYIKSCSDKCTLFIVCYLIQFILKIVQHVSNYVSSSSGTQFFITPAIDVWYSLKYIR
jgi:hypothetical protein